MKYFLLFGLIYTLGFADILNLTSFKANFTQTITDEKGQVLSYSGKVQALKPQSALWEYKKPVEKRVYIQNKKVSMVEPELEQVIIRKIASDFNFFSLLNSAKKIDATHYEAQFEESTVSIELEASQIASLAYKDKFDNDVKILFFDQHQNVELSPTLFEASYPSDYDVIVE